MSRFLLAVLLAALIVAVATRALPVRRALGALAALIALYMALKLTGVVDALAPTRQPWR